MESVCLPVEETFYANLPQTRYTKPYGFDSNTSEANYNRNPLLQEMLTLLLNGLVNPTGVTGQTATKAREIASNQIFGTSSYSGTLSSIAPGTYNTTADGTPKAYMVWTLFDNEFNLVKSSSGMVKIPNTPDTRQDIVKTDILMERGGYFYAYLVNESSMNVYFDDFQVTHVTGKVLEENHYYPFGMLNAQLSTRPTEKPLNHYKYNGKEIQEYGAYDFGARQYLPEVARWIVPDILSEKHPDLNPMMYANNNPIRFLDPDGMDWVEALNGDLTWRDDITAKNYKDKGVLKKGEVYRGTSYERVKNWNNQFHKGLVLEMYQKDRKMDFSKAKSVKAEISGEMQNSLLAYVNIALNATFENGKTKSLGSFTGVAGGFGNGAPENGNYTVDNYQDRSPSGWYNKGMNRDGVGYSFNLNPQFETSRSDLRIHPDGNNEGTLGCIGITGNKIVLINFRNNLKTMLGTGGPVPVNINIKDNPNNNGRNGKKIPNINE